MYKLRNWSSMSQNTNENNWGHLSCNAHNCAFEMLKQNQDNKMNWDELSKNPNEYIFESFKYICLCYMFWGLFRG